MTLYLTSSPTGTYLKWDEKEFDGFNEANGLVEEMKKSPGTDIRCLVIAATPEAWEQNDFMTQDFAERLECSGFNVERMDVLDGRNAEDITDLKSYISEFNFIILGGGHVPTQNEFFRKLGLREAISSFDGAVMGISAGTMNCADIVYAQPEEPGESTDTDYQRFIPGLGLTEINVLPHYNAVKDFMLDGRRLFEDITYKDSYGHTFYAVTDGSYIMEKDGETHFRGEIYKISDGQKSRL
ncbi:MAG: Type 1 glutamine amidotransferase-like domain-containing protein [Parasporobacterium sp.]|nr:Type 1 glutamine amidotransferase-like domain-containing protein [Parasporobacterium sp.]